MLQGPPSRPLRRIGGCTAIKAGGRGSRSTCEVHRRRAFHAEPGPASPGNTFSTYGGQTRYRLAWQRQCCHTTFGVWTLVPPALQIGPCMQLRGSPFMFTGHIMKKGQRSEIGALGWTRRPVVIHSVYSWDAAEKYCREPSSAVDYHSAVNYDTRLTFGIWVSKIMAYDPRKELLARPSQGFYGLTRCIGHKPGQGSPSHYHQHAAPLSPAACRLAPCNAHTPVRRPCIRGQGMPAAGRQFLGHWIKRLSACCMLTKLM